jgi:hypothetical protein
MEAANYWKREWALSMQEMRDEATPDQSTAASSGSIRHDGTSDFSQSNPHAFEPKSGLPTNTAAIQFPIDPPEEKRTVRTDDDLVADEYLKDMDFVRKLLKKYEGHSITTVESNPKSTENLRKQELAEFIMPQDATEDVRDEQVVHLEDMLDVQQMRKHLEATEPAESRAPPTRKFQASPRTQIQNSDNMRLEEMLAFQQMRKRSEATEPAEPRAPPTRNFQASPRTQIQNSDSKQYSWQTPYESDVTLSRASQPRQTPLGAQQKLNKPQPTAANTTVKPSERVRFKQLAELGNLRDESRHESRNEMESMRYRYGTPREQARKSTNETNHIRLGNETSLREQSAPQLYPSDELDSYREWKHSEFQSNMGPGTLANGRKLQDPPPTIESVNNSTGLRSAAHMRRADSLQMRRHLREEPEYGGPPPNLSNQ